MHTPTEGYAVDTARFDQDTRLLRVFACFFPAAYAVIGAWSAFGLLFDGWQVLDGGTSLRTLGGVVVAVQAMAAAALGSGIILDKPWRWRAFAGWSAFFLACGALYGIFGLLPAGMDRGRLLVTSLGGVGVTISLVALHLRGVERRQKDGP